MAKAKKVAPRVVEAQTKSYELMFILKPDLLESAVTKKLKELTNFLTDNSAKVTMEDIWGKQRLAYRIKQYEQGNYVVLNFDGLTTSIKNIDEHLRIDNDILRHLIIIVDNDYSYSKYDEKREDDVESKKDSKPKTKEEKAAAVEKSIGDVVKEKPATDTKTVKETGKEVEEKKVAPTEKEVEEVKGQLDKKLDKLLEGDDINI